MTDPAISLHNLEFSLGGKKIIQGLSLGIHTGGSLRIFGASRELMIRGDNLAALSHILGLGAFGLASVILAAFTMRRRVM